MSGKFWGKKFNGKRESCFTNTHMKEDESMSSMAIMTKLRA